MKLVFVGIALLVATVAVGIGCGPTEKYCYQDMDTCEHVGNKIKLDAMYVADADAGPTQCTTFTLDGSTITVPCDAN